MSKVAIAGNIILDVIKMIDSWPQKGMLSNILEQEQAVGGCVANTAVDLKILDPRVEVKCYGVVGNDDYGKYVKSVLVKHGLDITNVITSSKDSTSYTDVMTIPTGERTFFHNKGCYRNYDINDINVEELDCDLFHLGYLLLLDKFDAYDNEYGTKAAKLLANVQEKGIKTCIDLVSDSTGRFKEVTIPALKYCNYVVINDDVDTAVDKVKSILLSERCRVDRIEDIYLNTKEEFIHEGLIEKEFVNEDVKI